MKREYSDAIRQKGAALFIPSVVFVVPLVLYSGIRPKLPAIFSTGVLGTLLGIGFGLWAQFLPFAAFHHSETGDLRESRRLAIQDARLVVGFLVLRFAISVAIVLPLLGVMVIVFLIGRDNTGTPTCIASGFAFAISFAMLFIRYRLLITPCVALIRHEPVRAAARCSNSIVGQRRRDL